MRPAICTDDHGLRQPVRRPLGKVFKLDTTGKETVLHTFSGGADEALARAGLIRIAAGNLYGTTSSGAMELKKPWPCESRGPDSAGLPHEYKTSGEQERTKCHLEKNEAKARIYWQGQCYIPAWKPVRHVRRSFQMYKIVSCARTSLSIRNLADSRAAAVPGSQGSRPSIKVFELTSGR
jgi:hypothetical protein